MKPTKRKDRTKVIKELETHHILPKIALLNKQGCGNQEAPDMFAIHKINNSHR